MNEMTTSMSQNADLTSRSEQELQTMIECAKTKIERRKLEQEKCDIEEIRKIAKANNWSVNVSAQGLRISFTKKNGRGRPSKNRKDTSS